MSRIHRLALVAGAALAVAGAAHAGLNNLPPAGPLALDLAGQALPSGYTQYSTSFTATSASSVVTFVFRHDPGWFAFDDASVTANGGPNLLLDGGFEDAGLGPWTFFAQAGVSHTGFVGNASSVVGQNPWNPPVFDGAHDWLDGSTGGYDGLSQTIATTAGQVYTIAFALDQRLTQDVTATHFQQLSTNGQSGVLGNGIDMLVYGGDAEPSATDPLSPRTPGVPEPASWALMIMGFGFAGAALRARRTAHA